VETEPIAQAPQDNDLTPATPMRMRIAEVLVALGVVVLGVVILVESRDIRIPRALTVVGPRNIPIVIGCGLILVGIWYAIDVWFGKAALPSGDSEDADPTLPADWSVLAKLAVTLAVYAMLMVPAGFILASAALFTGTAYAMGSRVPVRDVAIGLVLASLTWLVFDPWLGIRLPAGLLGFLE
jgi:putative tricarboxylic transport membrane protein